MYKKIAIIFCCLLSGSFILSCTQVEDKATNSSNPSVAELTGVIVDRDTNAPIADVLVNIEDRSKHDYTDADGEFTIYLRPRSDTDDYAWEEEIGLLFQKEDYIAWQDGSAEASLSTSKLVTIERGRTTVVRVELVPAPPN